MAHIHKLMAVLLVLLCTNTQATLYYSGGAKHYVFTDLIGNLDYICHYYAKRLQGSQVVIWSAFKNFEGGRDGDSMRAVTCQTKYEAFEDLRDTPLGNVVCSVGGFYDGEINCFSENEEDEIDCPDGEVCESGAGGGSGGGSSGGGSSTDAYQKEVLRVLGGLEGVFGDSSMGADEKAAYNASKGKTKDGILSELTEETTINSMLDTSSLIGSGACIKDLDIELLGETYTIPLSNACPYLAMLGNVLLLVSMFIASRIVMRG